MADDNGNGGFSHWIRPIITFMLLSTFCALVIIKALGYMAIDFESSGINIAYQTMVVTAFGLWFGERAALKVPGKNS